MCELFAMSANQPMDIDKYLALLMPRGGKIGPHADGWGVAYYEGHASRVFKDANPAAESRYLRMLARSRLKSTAVIAHIRKANPSVVGRATANTHPFEREWNGYSWVFAHNGKLPGFDGAGFLRHSHFQPMGSTDSELAFCYLMETMASQIGYGNEVTPARVVDAIEPVVGELTRFGEFNFILGNGEYLFVHAHTHLHELSQTPMSSSDDRSTVLLATAPLTDDDWRALQPGTIRVYRDGRGMGALDG